jgi:hypothetical protein
MLSYLERIREALQHEQRVSLYKLFDKENGAFSLAAEWYTEGGKVYFQPRGRAIPAPALGPRGVVHERESDEITPERCAEMFLEHKIPVSEIRVVPQVTVICSKKRFN